MPLLRRTAQWVFFCALATAPWYYGGTTAVGINVINWLVGAALLLWIADLLVDRRWQSFPKVLLLLIAALLAIGGWMVLNASTVYDEDFCAVVPVGSIAKPLIGSFDSGVSSAVVI